MCFDDTDYFGVFDVFDDFDCFNVFAVFDALMRLITFACLMCSIWARKRTVFTRRHPGHSMASLGIR